MAENAAVEESVADTSTVATDITLTGAGATSDSTAVTVSCSTVTVSASGTYHLTGTLDDGQVVVDSADDGAVTLILDGVSISSSTSSPLIITDAGSAVVQLATAARTR